MEINKSNSESFDEIQSLRVIKEMIHVSKKKIKSDGILLIVWGYAMSINSLINYLNHTLFLTNRTHIILEYMDLVLPFTALLFTIFYIFIRRKKATTYIGLSLRYVWVSLFLSLMLINLVVINVLDQVNFTLQYPLFLVIIAFAIVTTGIILRYRLIIIGGIIFGALAYVCSYLALRDQNLISAIAWFIALVIPGHIMYFNRNK